MLVRRLVGQVRRVAQGDIDQRVDTDGRSEVGTIGGAVERCGSVPGARSPRQHEPPIALPASKKPTGSPPSSAPK
ncbi:HAMP domain-containing protein [Amycolatopsis alba]|uniref:HAMP domain-containing protein n=1 Tax=Amycolatopsis alba DSM 44262 TaxID=1125972 RepID=A0A229RFL5_AMYAL|nr:HAMP domain-containing protein [Amycolatopsis alba DSM 44262]